MCTIANDRLSVEGIQKVNSENDRYDQGICRLKDHTENVNDWKNIGKHG